ncbi:MAG: hypothetical protein N3A66_08335, partial [Planctomycetota bacterium]|nr:hypothetical protein [Planctomycetota bacterium]
MLSLQVSDKIRIENQRQQRQRFGGIGSVQISKELIRTGQTPMFVEIRSPYGIELTNFRLAKITAAKHQVTLRFAMHRRDGGPMEWQLHECRRLYTLDGWAQPPQPAIGTNLTLILEPAQREVGGVQFHGFRYRYRYQSRDIPIYYILDRGSWAPGGTILGNEFWMRNCFAPCIYRGRSRNDAYSTEWYLPSCPNPNIVQFLPLQTELQGFTFTVGCRGIVVTWATRVAHIRSLFYKPAGSAEMHHLHEHCGDLGVELETSPVEVLFAAGSRSRAEWMTLHSAWFDFVADELHKQIGMRRERMPSYGMIEEWGDADLVRYRREGLPKLLATGVKNICLANHFENNMNTYGVSNMCCTVNHRVAESVGEKNLRALCQA